MNVPDTHRVFKTLPNYNWGTLTGRLVQVFENLDVTNRVKGWKKVATEKQYSALDYYKRKTRVTIAKVKTNERNLSPAIEESHSLTEYYVPKAFNGAKTPPKILEFETKKDSRGVPQITSISASNGARVPKHDKYLALRMYDSDDVKKPITQIALEKNNLKGLDIPIEDSYSMDKKTCGSFSHHTGMISFNHADMSKADVIDTAFHEVTHAYQYAVMAITKRLEGTKFTQQCVDKFKGTVTPELEKEADEYLKAHKKYVPPEVNYSGYRHNLLEEEAWDNGNIELNSYYIDGTELRQSFRYFPKEEL